MSLKDHPGHPVRMYVDITREMQKAIADGATLRDCSKAEFVRRAIEVALLECGVHGPQIGTVPKLAARRPDLFSYP